jgi:acyl-CoA hydrolase
MRYSQRPTVTVAIDSMSFKSPVHVGELVALHARLSYVGRSSMEVEVRVSAENPILGTVTHTNSAYVVMVALDDDEKPCKVPQPAITTSEEQVRLDEGKRRQELRRKQG